MNQPAGEAFSSHAGTRPAAWYENWTEVPDSPWRDRPEPAGEREYRTLTCIRWA